MANKQNRETAQQEFRKFAWNLAGTLAKTAKPAPARPGKR